MKYSLPWRSPLFKGRNSSGIVWDKLADDELAVAAKARDRAGKEAFIEIVRRHQSTVCAVIFGVAGRVSLVDDAAQDTFLAAWKQLPNLRQPERLKPWLAKIAHGCAVDALKRELRQSRLCEEDACSTIVNPVEPPDDIASRAEDEALLWECLAQLPESLRTPLALFYRQGCSIAEIGATLEITNDAAKQRLHRGREALREALAMKFAVRAESTLSDIFGRIAPSSLLVVGVAASIGLLSAPTTIAAAATSTSGSLFGEVCFSLQNAILMTTKTKLTLAATVALVACFGAGYYTGHSVYPPRQELLATVASPSQSASLLTESPRRASVNSDNVTATHSNPTGSVPESSDRAQVPIPREMADQLAMGRVFGGPRGRPSKLSEEGIALLGIEPRDAEILNAKLATLEQQSLALQRQHTRLVKDSPEEQIFAIDSFAEEGQALEAGVRAAFVEAIGQERADALLERFPRPTSQEGAFLGWGERTLTFQPTDEGFHVRDEHLWKGPGGGTSNDTNVWDTETFPEEFQGLLSVEEP
ncbi:MAG: sigma-70 family RNA polymerase sigma factor [Verrucomicrobiales bacterium]